MKLYQVEVTRDGRWWMVNVPEIHQVTQARRVGEIEDMARSLIAISTEQPAESIAINVASITVPDVGDVAADALHVRGIREDAEAAARRAADYTAAFARKLTAVGVPVRDIAELLHVSPQRISQLTG